MALRLFSGEERAVLAEQADSWGSFILANLLWAALSIPLVTLPAATAGLFAVMMGRARGTPDDLFPTYFSAMRRFWLKATVIALGNLAAGGLVALNLSIVTRMDSGDLMALVARSVTLFVAIVLLLGNLYLWPLLVVTDWPLRRLLDASFRLTIASPLWSLGVFAAAMVPIIVSLALPKGLFILATVSAVALIICRGTWRVIRRYLPETEPDAFISS